MVETAVDARNHFVMELLVHTRLPPATGTRKLPPQLGSSRLHRLGPTGCPPSAQHPQRGQDERDQGLPSAVGPWAPQAMPRALDRGPWLQPLRWRPRAGNAIPRAAGVGLASPRTRAQG
eukprot:4253182-Pyramimonas_sp.AAC.1